MRKLAKVSRGIMAGLALLAGATVANADCASYGKIQELYTYSGSGTPFTYVYFAPNGVGPQSYWFYGYTYDTQTAGQLAAAKAANDTVYIDGNTTSCATSGSYRYVGQLSFAESFKSY